MQPETLKKLFGAMLRIRMAEEAIAERYSEQEMRCPVHLCIGQEGVPAGVCAHLSSNDYVMSNHRSHGHYLAKGGNLNAMIAELYGKAAGCSEGKGGSMHLVDLKAGFLGASPIVASTIPIAVGAAFGSMMKKENRVTVAFFGEGATEEGVFHESLNFAMLKNVPMIFVCENNLYSVYSPLSVRRPKGREVFELAKGHGMESVQGDGNDVAEVYDIAEKAVEKARAGKGPTFLEFKTYRWREHCGPLYDNDLGYRTESEFEAWKKRCPVERTKKELIARNILDSSAIEGIEKNLEAELSAAFEFAKKSPFPKPDALTERVYAA